ncbi:hypothetical protein B0H67DRAFT_545450 [Lasiosphaeris hirsuta]|uniref:[histone H3]-trimethyl-L-lysine(9) demethylase n=1 Tax=Lasiosphaeris hirsuta TaxID=260670 RepID=A0AA39ZWJ5_9PEZI|nr:hypothetical protein B0H67DRAFT_545450 [Lasiosphaeris hirsuta]
MSTEPIGAAAPETTIIMDVDQPAASSNASTKPTGLHSPPDSNNAMNLDGSDSELSDLDEVANKLNDGLDIGADSADDAAPVPALEEEEIGEILPDHWSGTVPVFRPTMIQFKDFKRFMEKVDNYGMKSGIVKIIPPQEWKDALTPLDELVKQVRVREPIKQDIMGSNGTYRQVNILHQRSYNLPQWRQLCDQSEHQPPARRGERRANAEKHKPVTRSRAAANTSKDASSTTSKKRKGRVTRGSAKAAKEEVADPEERPMTPVSPAPEKEEVMDTVENDPGVKEEDCEDEDDVPVVRRMGFARQSKPKTQSTSARRKYIRREGSARIDEEAFRDWDYRMDVSDYTPERCEELERTYWKTLTYAPPLYGADLPGTLFPESNEIWNLNRLPNLLDVLGTKVPGVNTAYLYLGMWKATFAWHLEDVDLYSINYLHFGAPKQWYSISQADARRFEAAMKNIWPTEAKACDQFLRHKAFLISPAHLKQHYNITVNKCVSYPGEFVVTYPYGYHSGYNLGYNCAEAVNFALDSWLPMGKIAKKCQCAQAQDSVWVDVYEIERKMRGEETEYEETEDEEEEEDDDDNDTGLPSPPSSHTVRVKAPGGKRKRPTNEEGRRVKVKKIKLKPQVEPPCCLCPNDIPGAEIMSTDDGRKAHRMCALYLPETYIETVDDKEIIANVGGIDKARLDLKCLYCRSKKGACFQCSVKKCPRAYHATCAAAAGVFVEEADVPVIGEDGTEYKEQAFEFSCRFHRTKRDRKQEGAALEEDKQIREAAAALNRNDICQIQYFRGDIFAGVVLENRQDEESLVLHIIPNGDRVEVEWKWLLLPDPADLRLPKASPNAIPMPTSRKAKQELNAKRPVDDVPRKDDEFGTGFVWAEFHSGDLIKNAAQVKLDLSKENQIWHYLGKTSTESKAQYTEDMSKPEHNLKSSFLDSIPKPPKPVAPMAAPPQPRRSYSATHPSHGIPAKVSPVPLPPHVGVHLGPKLDRPYVYKPRKSTEPYNVQFTAQAFTPKVPGPPALLPQLQPQQFPQRPSLPQPVHQQRPGPQVPLLPHHHQQQQQQQQQQPHQPHQPHQQYQPQPQQQQYPQHQPALQVKQYQPVNKEPRQKNTASYSSDRFAPVGGSNGFPQLPGLTWPPAHMKSGHYSQPQSRVWPTPTDAAAAGPPSTPMTSSVIRSSNFGHPQAGPAGGQPHTSAFQKYSFFQVYHNSAKSKNRDSSRYRTPYGHYGGFTNGYEGNLRTFLIKAQRALMGEKTHPIKAIPPSLLQPLQPRPSASPGPSNSPGPGYNSPYNAVLPRPIAQSPRSAHPPMSCGMAVAPAPASPYQNRQVQNPSTPGNMSFEIRQPGSVPLHPAIRPQYGNPRTWQNSPNQASDKSWSMSPQAQAQGPGSAPAPVPAPVPARPAAQSAAPAKAQVFAKQSHSPIPLPPYVKQAAMASASAGSRSSPLSRPPQQPTSRTPGPAAGADPPAPRQLPLPTASTESVTTAQLHDQPQPRVDVKTAQPAPPSVPQYHNPPPPPSQQPQQQMQWIQSHDAPRYPAPPMQCLALQEQAPVYHQATGQVQGGAQVQEIPQTGGYSEHSGPGPSGLAGPTETPSDPLGLVERMMLNLKRATQIGRST